MPEADQIVKRTSAQGATIQSVLGIRVRKAYLQNLENGRLVPFLFNPTQLEENYSPIYKRHGSVGLSHKRMQYVGHENTRIPLELVYDQIVATERFGNRTIHSISTGNETPVVNDAELWRRKLIEMQAQRRGKSILDSAPPALLFHWPGMINMRVRIVSLRMRTVEFQAGTAHPRIILASVVLEEDALENIYSQDAVRSGTFRTWASRPR